MPQLNVDVTESVKERLADLEVELEADEADAREIVAVLIQRASAKQVTQSALRKYRTEFKAEKKRRAQL